MSSFFECVLPSSGEGWVPIITKDPYGGLSVFRWFMWPVEHKEMSDYLMTKRDEDVYFSPFLYEEPPTTTNSKWASKQHVKAACVVWADGDGMDVSKLRVKPTCYVQSSATHWQAYWRFDDAANYSIFDMEDLSHGLYDAHAGDGMDRGWPLAKKMRVPFTLNTKPEYGLPFEVTYEDRGYALSVAEFAAEYPPTDTVTVEVDGSTMPEYTADEAFEIIAQLNSNVVNDLFLESPAIGDDWSARMYHLECELFERACDVQNTFVVMQQAACNKFARDGRPDSDLWKQVNRDHERWQQGAADFDTELIEESPMPVQQNLEADSLGLYWAHTSFVEDGDEVASNTFADVFARWVQQRSGQSPVAFNYAASVMLMSASLARYAKMPLSFGDMGLNTYMMVLGKTTQSRKTTSMNKAKAILRDISDTDPDEYLIPDDVTSEALSEWLAGKPQKSTVFIVDEFQDLLVAAEKRGSYVSGVIPFLTKAYDGLIPGVLRKAAQTKYQKPTEHYMSFYGTGILNQSAGALTTARIESGFIPRCLIVVDDRMGFTPGADDVAFMDEDQQEQADAGRRVVSKMLKRAITYWDSECSKRQRTMTADEDPRIAMKCEPEAFMRWQKFAYAATWLASDHPLSARELYPMTERMTYTTLRIAALLAMMDRTDTITMKHVVKAISLADIWVPCSEVLVHEVSNNGFSKDIAEVEQFVAGAKGGQVSYEFLLTKFQNRFDNPRRMGEVLQYCQSMGSLQEIIDAKTKKRFVRFVRKGRVRA